MNVSASSCHNSSSNRNNNNSYKYEQFDDYYSCHPRHFNKYKLGQDPDFSVTNWLPTTRCSCCVDACSADHFCTRRLTDNDKCKSLDDNPNESDQSACSLRHSDGRSRQHGDAMVVCENNPASFTSKKEQLSSIRSELRQLQQSKRVMQQALRDMDELIESNTPADVAAAKAAKDALGPIEYFYRYDTRFVGRAMHIKSLDHNRARADIQPGRLRPVSGKKDDEVAIPTNGAALFSLNSKRMFVDSDLMRFHDSLKPRRPKSANTPKSQEAPGLIYMVKK